MAGSAPRKRPQERSAHGVDRAAHRSPQGRFAVVAARFNEAISKKLADGAASALEAGGVAGERVEVHWVPGSFELPQAAMALARTGRYAGIVGVGVITSLTEAQAWDRAGGAVGHRGEEAARAVLEMAAWMRGLRAGRAAKRRR